MFKLQARGMAFSAGISKKCFFLFLLVRSAASILSQINRCISGEFSFKAIVMFVFCGSIVVAKNKASAFLSVNYTTRINSA